MENQHVCSKTHWDELALEIPELFISTIAAKVPTGRGQRLEQPQGLQPVSVDLRYLLVYSS